MVLDAGNPIALSSDAHTPDQLGFGYDRALETLADLGVTELCVFERRGRRLEPIGAT
jgi:histidinol-phosphatase (PHP family)